MRQKLSVSAKILFRSHHFLLSFLDDDDQTLRTRTLTAPYCYMYTTPCQWAKKWGSIWHHQMRGDTYFQSREGGTMHIHEGEPLLGIKKEKIITLNWQSNMADEDEDWNNFHFVIHKINFQHNGVKYSQKQHPFFHAPQDIYELVMVQKYKN